MSTCAARRNIRAVPRRNQRHERPTKTVAMSLPRKSLLCGPKTHLGRAGAKALKNFRAQLRKALDDLVENEDIKDWMIEMPADLVKVDRGAAITGSQKRYIGVRKPRI